MIGQIFPENYRQMIDKFESFMKILKIIYQLVTQSAGILITELTRTELLLIKTILKYYKKPL